MKKPCSFFLNGMTAAMLLGLFTGSASSATIVSSIGYSGTETDYAKAGQIAARMAIDSLKGKPCKLAIVYVATVEMHTFGNPQPALSAVNKIIDSTIVFGGTMINTLAGGNKNSLVSVLALSGDFNFYSFVPKQRITADSAFAGGKALGQEFSKVTIAADQSRLILVYGPYYDKADQFAKGVEGTMGKNVPLAGAAASSIYVKGKMVIYDNTMNYAALGIMLTGNFTAAFAMKGNDPGAVTNAITGPVARLATGSNKDKISLSLIFDCGSRLGLSGELDTLKSVLGTKTPVFGLYGHGEIGKPANDSAAMGAGYSISICNLVFNNSTGVYQPSAAGKPSAMRSSGMVKRFIALSPGRQAGTGINCKGVAVIAPRAGGVYIEKKDVNDLQSR